MAGKRGRRSDNPDSSPPSSTAGLLAFRVAVGLGDPERERRLIPALGEGGELVVVERCLTADVLIACAREGRADVVLGAFDLHRLTASVLDDLLRTRVPVVLLAERPDEERWQKLSGSVLPLDCAPATVRQALLGALRGERASRYVPPEPKMELVAQPAEETPATGHGPDGTPETRARQAEGRESTVVAIASGPGSPGRSTVALSLATALGAVAPTILVDADLAAPSLVAYLDADPTRNLYMLAHAEPTTPREWDRALEREVQPLGRRSPGGVFLGGIPKPEMRTGVSGPFFERLVAELRTRYRYVILDIGTELLGTDGAVHRAGLGLADQVLLVAAGDLVGLWRARSGLKLLQTAAGVSLDRVVLALNRHDRRYHHRRAEVEWALGVATAAVIPEDFRGAQRAVAAQRPVVLEERGQAAHALLDLAERLHGGEVRLPPEPDHRSRFGWLSRLRPRLSPPRLAVRLELFRRRAKPTAETTVERGGPGEKQAAPVR